MTNIVKTVGGLIIDEEGYLDKDTYLVSFRGVKKDNGDMVYTEAERWFNENDSIHIVDNYYDSEGNFLDAIENDTLTDAQRNEIQEYLLHKKKGNNYEKKHAYNS